MVSVRHKYAGSFWPCLNLQCRAGLRACPVSELFPSCLPRFPDGSSCSSQGLGRTLCVSAAQHLGFIVWHLGFHQGWGWLGGGLAIAAVQAHVLLSITSTNKKWCSRWGWQCLKFLLYALLCKNVFFEFKIPSARSNSKSLDPSEIPKTTCVF